MTESSITFFPVNNGDTSLLSVSEGNTLTYVIIDCHISNDPVYDVPTYLQNVLPKTKDDIPHVDVFMLTHPHDDHVLGFNRVFYTGDPADYSDDDEQAGRILIDELWFAPKIFNDKTKELSDDAKKFREEAKRRIDLFTSKKHARNSPGNRLRIIGATNNEKLSELEEITTRPGETLNILNNKILNNFRFFVYAPVIWDTDQDDINPNNTSIVVQARFDIDGVENSVKIFLGGDAECPIWERIVSKNDDENLAWDLLLAPHHCSWSVFSLDPYTEDSEPSEKVLHLLNQKRGYAYIVSSSKPILDNDDNPPSYRAKQIYVKKVGESRFICTGEHPTEKNPEPIYFTFSNLGVTMTDLPEDNVGTVEKAIGVVASSPRKYG
jgi:hypothetical protein